MIVGVRVKGLGNALGLLRILTRIETQTRVVKCYCNCWNYGTKRKRNAVFLKSSFYSFVSFTLIYQAVNGTSSQTVDHDSLNDTLMQLVWEVFEWAPVVLTACSIISYIPYSDQTRARTSYTYLSLWFAVNLTQYVSICHFCVLAICSVSIISASEYNFFSLVF